MYGANVFTASDNQTLDAVGVWVLDDDVEVCIDVRVGLTDPANPESAEPACSFSYPVECWGWYTIDLPQTVAVDAGQTFSIVVSLLDDDGDGSVPVGGRIGSGRRPRASRNAGVRRAGRELPESHRPLDRGRMG